MEKHWSKSWKSSVQSRKQRKYQKNAPLHIKRKFLTAPLSKELRKTHGVRAFPVRRGDTVKMMTGQFKGSTGKVTAVSIARSFIHVDCAKLSKRDGTEAFYPVHASNVEIVKLDLSDSLRSEKLKSIKREEATKE